METFTWKAVDSIGAQSKGSTEAESRAAVTEQLRQRGLVVLEVVEKRKSKELAVPGMNKVKATDMAIMTRQLATMINSGMTILRALMIIEQQTENGKLRDTLVAIGKDVEAGLPFSDALERHPELFDRLYVGMVRAGETGGGLDASLMRVADQLEASDSLRRQVKSAMVYPIV